MQESYSVEERYRDLVERAEEIILWSSVTNGTTAGYRLACGRWLNDLTKTRDMQACEGWREVQEFGRAMRDGEEPDGIIDVD